MSGPDPSPSHACFIISGLALRPAPLPPPVCMTTPPAYNPAAAEEKWYQYWLDQRYFESKPNSQKQPYTIVIPPPNVTGVLHMGHMLNNTIQDALVRRARMRGFEALWVPGTDHASIATEARVVAMLKEQGLSKKDVGREGFLKHAFEWKEKYGGIILEQLKKLGAGCDWTRTRFTMEDELTAAVIHVFVDLYRKGHIYRGVRMVNWDPQGKTALSDEEVYHKEVQSRLVYIKYFVEGSNGSQWITVATTRPETIFADVAIAVNPADERYHALLGKTVLVPLINRPIKVIADDYVAADFGTGCLKVTPAHDINDYEIGMRHNLPVIDLLADDGTLNEHGHMYAGQDRFAVRKQIVLDLEAAGHIEKIEEIKNNLGYSERTNAVIEPRLSMQWFLKMKELAQPALENVMNDTVRLHPPKFKNMYRSWMENVRDWCISRQLWWGQRIPAYYLPDNRFVVAETPEEALQLAQALQPGITAEQLRQDDDVLDTWFSSWLWPISVFDGFKDPKNADIEYYYPTADLVTAPEILFFWVARMIIAGYEYRGTFPFKNVYLTGIVRDKQGRKMSKSLGNSPDPLELIAKYGADGVRTGMLFSSPAGNDLLFDEKLVEQGRNFWNKIYNAFRLVKGWQVVEEPAPAGNDMAISWFGNRLNQAVAEIDDHFDKYRMSDALLATYKLVWDDFCSWYLEMVKPAFGAPIDRATYEATVGYFEQLMKLVHPFMPFISEEVWQNLRERAPGQSICIEAWPTAGAASSSLTDDAAQVIEVIQQVRALRNSRGLSPKEALPLFVRTSRPALYESWQPIMAKLANLAYLKVNEDKPAGAVAFAVRGDECAVLLPSTADAAEERQTLLKELEYARGFLDSVMKKLGNEKFVANAKPDVLAREEQKRDDAQAKIKALEELLGAMPA